MRVPCLLAALVMTACGSSSPKGIGEECFGATDCAAGLVCDVNVTPHVCAENLTIFDAPPDAGPEPDAPEVPDAPPGAPDARVDARPPDATPIVPDAAVPDAAVPDAAVPDAL
jgi:hypothetical protein